MESEEQSRIDIAPVDISSVDCLLKKTWRYYPIAPLQSSCDQPEFIQTLVPSIRQYFQRKAMALGDTRLQVVLIHDIVNVHGFDYAKGYYLKFQSEGRILEFRCCVFSNLENDDEKQHSFLLIKGRKDIRSTFLEWFQQVFDIFINYSSHKLSPYQLTIFCNKAYQAILPSLEKEDTKESSVICTFRLPSYIDGLKHITITISTNDLYRVNSNFPVYHYECMDIIKKQLCTVLSIEPSICIVEEVSLPNVIITKDGRIKFNTTEGITTMLDYLSKL